MCYNIGKLIILKDTKMEFKITIQDSKALIFSPYNPTFVTKVKSQLDGTWNATLKAWSINANDVDLARDLMVKIYGRSDQDTELVDVKVKILEELFKNRAPIVFLGRVIAAATGRDSGAKVGEGVVLKSGNIGSGGSAKNWYTEISAGTEIIIHDLPLCLASGKLSNCEIEILEKPAKESKENLLEEKQKLLLKIAEIDAKLQNY